MTDYTGKFGPLYPASAAMWPIYSFAHPAHAFWNGVANELERRGFKEDAIQEWLQSKDARWMLDKYGQELHTLGAKMVADYLK